MSDFEVKVSTPSEREVRVERVFDAPSQLVFDAHTKPELVVQWLYGPEEWPLAHCEIDFRVGGTYRYIWRNKEKGDMGLSGVYKEIIAPEKIVHTELFDDDWTDGEALVATLFREDGGRTTVTATVRYASQKTRDEVLKTGMIDGWTLCFNRLEKLLPTLQ